MHRANASTAFFYIHEAFIPIGELQNGLVKDEMKIRSEQCELTTKRSTSSIIGPLFSECDIFLKTQQLYKKANKSIFLNTESFRQGAFRT